MVGILLVKSTGSIIETKIRSLSNLDPNLLFTKCGFRKGNGFEKKNTWKNIKINNEKVSISLFARETGKAGHENKYDLPPPVDNILYFNTFALVRHDDNNEPVDLDLETWDLVYNKLFGGFEDLSKTKLLDEMEPDELDEIDDKHKTKNGYLKDGFVIDENENLTSPSTVHSESSLTSDSNFDSEEEDESDYNSELDEEEYEYQNQA